MPRLKTVEVERGDEVQLHHAAERGERMRPVATDGAAANPASGGVDGYVDCAHRIERRRERRFGALSIGDIARVECGAVTEQLRHVSSG